jgi:HAD superfamily hydrolase (TIGR01549 family)
VRRSASLRPSPARRPAPPCTARVIKAVVFDVGECLLKETREYGTWADWLGVPRHSFSAMFGAIIARGQDWRETFRVFRPGFDLTEERDRRALAGLPEWFDGDDLYPDVRPALNALRADGIWVGIAGNRTVRAGGMFRSLGLPSDLIAASEDWGVSKPDPALFHRVTEAAPYGPDEILYVGDRLDNDIRPASTAGLKTALIRRGPWGITQQNDPDADQIPTTRVDSLSELPLPTRWRSTGRHGDSSPDRPPGPPQRDQRVPPSRLTISTQPAQQGRYAF